MKKLMLRKNWLVSRKLYLLYVANTRLGHNVYRITSKIVLEWYFGAVGSNTILNFSCDSNVYSSMTGFL